MLHTPEDGRPSLGLDLTEEFRQAMADWLVLHLANNRVLSPSDDFTNRGAKECVRLLDAPRRKFFLAYGARMTESFVLRPGGSQTCLRECLRALAHALARAFRDSSVPYCPFVLR